jgi:hypothetical protein
MQACMNKHREDPKTPNYVKLNHPKDHVIRDADEGMLTRSKARNELSLIFQIEPKTTDEAYKEASWIKEMKEELN